MGQFNERGRFSTHRSETPQPIFMKLEIYNYFPDTTPYAKFQGAVSKWVASLTHESFFFVCFFTGATGRIFGYTPANNTSLYVVLGKVVPFGG